MNRRMTVVLIVLVLAPMWMWIGSTVAANKAQQKQAKVITIDDLAKSCQQHKSSGNYIDLDTVRVDCTTFNAQPIGISK